MESGTRLGHYEILAPLGAGGMGQVYRARDTRLDRDVAIKVLPEDFASDAGWLARFEREAKLLASLNHPNVATIFGFDESNGVRFIAMELVEGQSLAERITASGCIPVDDALQIGRQIAVALEAAHAAGVIHRDLKPANVQVATDGTVKVLDFGLAKAYEAEGSGPSSDLSRSPTAMMPTATGVIMGTAPYMSPEQARAEPVDKRTDIWSFGCVLYEMITGARAFDGASAADVFGGILEREPDWKMLPPTADGTPKRLLRRCLQKDRDRRLHDIADARLEIDEALAPSPEAAVTAKAPPAVRSGLQLVPWAIAVLAVTALFAVGWWPRGNLTSLDGPVRLTLELEPGLRLAGGYPGETWNGAIERPSRTAMAISPDGQTIVYCAADGAMTRLYRRDLGVGRATPMAGTENGCNPFFSPDGRSVAFFTGVDEDEDASMSMHLKTVSVAGGEPRTLLTGRRSGGTWGGTWGLDGDIVFADDAGLYRIPAAGGSPERLLPQVAERNREYHWLPRFLPSGNSLLLTSAGGTLDRTRITALSSLDDEPHILVEDAADALYLATGHLFVRPRGDPVRCAVRRLQRRHAGQCSSCSRGRHAGAARVGRDARYSQCTVRCFSHGHVAVRARWRLPGSSRRLRPDGSNGSNPYAGCSRHMDRVSTRIAGWTQPALSRRTKGRGRSVGVQLRARYVETYRFRR